jgi:hypothetical protein
MCHDSIISTASPTLMIELLKTIPDVDLLLSLKPEELAG